MRCMQSRVSSRAPGPELCELCKFVQIVLCCQAFMPLTTQCFRQLELRPFMSELKNGNDLASSYRKPLYGKSNRRPWHIGAVHSSLYKSIQPILGERSIRKSSGQESFLR